jgi:hypothetical protein
LGIDQRRARGRRPQRLERRGKDDGERAPLPFVRSDLDATAGALHDALADREAEPCALSFVVKKGKKSFSSALREMPGPVSATVTSTNASSLAPLARSERVPRPKRTRVDTFTRPPDWVACIALRIRFIST